MLAKQVWRFHTNPNSLITQVFKARYYPSSDLFQAPMGSSPSYAWRSIHQSIWVLSKGCCWRVGNGHNINIWKDKWLPNQNGLKVIIPNTNNPNIVMVKDLIIDNPPSWNKSIIEDTFLPIDGLQILQLPITHKEQSDSIMWTVSENGDYSVKTGYQAIQLLKNSQGQGPSNHDLMEKVWKIIWRFDTIPRYKVLVWRILNKALPVRDELHKRGIPCSLLCPRCESRIETINHLFLKCDKSRKEWFGSQLGINFHNTDTSYLNDWLIDFLLKNDKDTVISMIALLYSIWHARNQKVFEDKEVPDRVVIQRAHNSVSSFKEAKISDTATDSACNFNGAKSSDLATDILIDLAPHISTAHATSSSLHKSKPMHGTSSFAQNKRIQNSAGPPHQLHPINVNRNSTKDKWVRPEQDLIKLNSDANLSVPDLWGIGVIARNDEGLVMAAGTWSRPGFFCATTAEAWGVF